MFKPTQPTNLKNIWYNPSMIHINFTLTYFELYLIVINIFTIMIYGIDKLRAVLKASHNRVSEKVLLGFALIGGTVGAIISMILFRHKIKKLSFVLKFIVLIVIQAILYYCYINKLWYNFEYINNIIGWYIWKVTNL